MSADFPVWPTAKAVMQYCWRERRLALRYAEVPILLMIAIDVGATALGVDIGNDNTYTFATTAIAIIAFAPLMVTWYLSIILGEDEARRRPLFTFGMREGSVVMTNILVGIAAVVAGLVLAGIVAIASGVITPVSKLAGQIVAVVTAVPALFVWIMVFTRLSMVIAFAAAGRHVGLRETWRITRPFGVPFTWTHILLAIIGNALAAIPPALIAGAFKIAGYGGEEGEPAPLLDLATSAADTVFGVIYILFATTLFGFVYMRLAPQDAPVVQESL